ncbi:polyprenol phosphomannose-dependent alpha 1,6 mannosyltransferase MptB [Kribbella sancticallisti]
MRMPSALLRGLAGSCVVAAASLVTSVVPESSWIASLPIAADLRSNLLGRMTGLTFMVAGLGLMAWAWLSVGREVFAGMRHRLLPLVVCWSAPLLLIPPLFSRDAWSYAAQGALVAEGHDPYGIGPGVLSGHIIEAVDPMWMSTPAPYGPLPLAYGGLAARIAVLGLRSSIHNAARAVGIALLAVVLLGPTAHDWYFVWCLPFLAVARPGRRLTTALISVSTILTIAAPLNSSLRGAVVPILVTTSLVLVVVGCLLGRLRTIQPQLADGVVKVRLKGAVG